MKDKPVWYPPKVKPNCMKCTNFLEYKWFGGVSWLCMAVGGKVASEIHGSDACLSCYEERPKNDPA